MVRELIAIDLGTTKFCLALLRAKSHGDGYTVDMLSIPARGMSYGMLADFSAAKGAIRDLLDLCARTYGHTVEKIVVGVAGSHLRGRRVTVRTKVAKAIVDMETVQELLFKAEETAAQGDSREVIHCVPIHYQIDDRQQVQDPIGFSGSYIQGTFFLIEANRAYLRDIVRVCNDAGVEVSRLIAEPFASASVSLTEEEKTWGVAVVDIGGGTTDGVVFQEGRPSGLFSINVAGQVMTNDLAVGLSLRHEDAERLKISFGIATGLLGDTLPIANVNGQLQQYTWRDVYPILAPRIKELGHLVLQATGLPKPHLRAGLRFTGGGCQVEGICEYLQATLGLTIKRTLPSVNSNTKDGPSLPIETRTGTIGSKYATALGLVNLEVIRLQDEARLKQQIFPKRYLSKFVNWIREMS